MDNMTPDASGSALSNIDDAAKALDSFVQAAEAKNPTPKPQEEPEAESAEVPQEAEETSDQNEPETTTSESEQPAEESVPETVQITLPDGKQITADEAVKGYLRQDDYTRKTQKLSEMEKQRQAQFTEATKHVKATYEQLVALQEPEPDWVELAATLDPREYNVRFVEYNKRQQAMAQVRQNLDAWQQQQQQAIWQETLGDLSTGTYNPEWKDPNKLQAGIKAMSEYALNEGVPQEYLQAALPSPVLKILDKARKYDELQKAKPQALKVVVNKPKPIKPGTKAALPPAQADAKTALNRFHQKKDMDSGMEALSRLVAAAKPQR